MDESHLHKRRFHKKAELLRSTERIVLLEVNRVVRSCLEGLLIRSVLDVGTGTGVFAEAFAQLGLLVTGIDPNAELLAMARRYVPNAEFRETAAEDLPFEADSFDLVFLGHVLHEADDPQKALREARRVGSIRVSVLEWPYRREEQGPPLKHRLRPATIQDLAREAGFRDIKRSQLTHMDLYHLTP
jgi:ubiquinone/menaquinone biosynthesis C-methylase UbiE